jgi:hypothetical protein
MTTKFDNLVNELEIQLIEEGFLGDLAKGVSGKMGRAVAPLAFGANLALANPTPKNFEKSQIGHGVVDQNPHHKPKTYEQQQEDKDKIMKVINTIKYDPNSIVTPKFVMRLARQESNFNPDIEGKDKDRGVLQITPIAWNDAQTNQKIKHDFDKAFDIEINIEMGVKHLKDLERRFKKYKINHPTEEQLYAAWNAGMKNLKNARFDVKRLASTHEKFRENLQTFLKIKSAR